MNITVYCGSNPGANPRFLEAAEQLGTWIGRAGHCLVYGGSSVGLMGAVSRAALAAGGCVEGVEPRFFIDAGVAQHDLTRLHVVETMAERKALMIELGDAFVALPGGVGTLEEISEIMSQVRLSLGPRRCYLLNLDGFYDPLRQLLGAMLDQGFLDQRDVDAFLFPTSVDELTAALARDADELAVLGRPSAGTPRCPEALPPNAG
ncbi:MAG: TIGR00730 family Rossman fold protein [Eggerthellaceae bacterium]|nr:TIGR00730 family Rossman fold protein [Eggerthellaceae bacterium]